MSDIATLTANLLAKSKQDYLAEFTAWANKVKDDLSAASALLLTAVTATSASSLTLGTGQQTANVGPGKGFKLGMLISVANASDKKMTATVDGYTDNATGPLTFTVAASGDVTGTGTYNAWTISLSGPRGTAGAGGAAGPAGADGEIAAGASLAMYSNFGVWGY
ncbi:MAG: hypothetical protein SFV21_00240 [Rhodospirillaceae bacterium]|nr:hypothetical protein [Rhodospirillaceae bacterium]